MALDISQNNNGQQLLDALLGTTTGLSNITFKTIGDARAFGVFQNDPFSLTKGVVLSTGKVLDLPGKNQIDNGFTQAPTGSTLSEVLTRSDLNTDFGFSGTENDTISFQIDFDADSTATKLFFQYVFGSEELVEFGGKSFNDSFTLELNGFNLATLSDGAQTTINNLAATPYGPYNSDFISNSVDTGPNKDSLKLDGYTKPLLFEGDLLTGKNSLVITVQDVGDGFFDSAVFLKGGSLGTVRPAPIDTNPSDGSGGSSTGGTGVTAGSGGNPSDGSGGNSTGGTGVPAGSGGSSTGGTGVPAGSGGSSTGGTGVPGGNPNGGTGDSGGSGGNPSGGTGVPGVPGGNPSGETGTEPSINNKDSTIQISDAPTQGTNLFFNLTGSDAGFINEVGLFKVNDDKGGLDLDEDGVSDLFPGDRDYTQAVLEHGKVIFSAIPEGGISDAARILDGFKGGARLAFYLVQNSTSDEVLRGITPATKVLFGSAFDANSSQQMQIVQSIDGDELTLQWEDGANGGDQDFNDLIFTVSSTNQAPPKGTRLQGLPQGELLDLRGIDLNGDGQTDPIIQAIFQVNSEAVNDNLIGFYRVDNTDGLIGNLLPGDVGYAVAAIQRTVVSFDRNGIDSVQLAGEDLGLLAPYIIANSTLEEFLQQNPDNLPETDPNSYFNYLGANPDRVDHVRLLGDNAFGFEDSFSRGNFDFNDIVVQAHLSPAA